MHFRTTEKQLVERPDLAGLERRQRRRRRLEAMHSNAIEGNPFDADDVALFEMFDREGFTDEERISYIRQLALAAAKDPTPSE